FEQQSHRLRFGDVDRYGRLSAEGKDGVAIEAPELVVGDPLAEQMDELANVVRTRTPVEVGPAEGLRAVAVVDAGVQSWSQGGKRIEMADLLSEAGADDGE